MLNRFQPADGLAAQPQWDRVHGAEPGGHGGRCEPWPPGPGGIDVGDRHRFSGAHRIDTGALMSLELEQLEQAERLARGGHQLQAAALVDQQQPCLADVQETDAGMDQVVQDLDHVVVVDQGVGQRDEGFGEQVIPG
jgi:hypothetical protein